MVRSERGSERAGEQRIFVCPNASLTHRQALLVFVGISAVSLTIATSFGLLGGWMVLPFSGSELVFLGCCLYYSMRQASACEIVIIGEQRVRIEKGYRHSLEQQHEFHRGWARIILKAPAIKGYPSRLFIQSHGKQVEIGHFLVESERRQLAAVLKRSLARPGN
jgi:uncharacterized membrane protein